MHPAGGLVENPMLYPARDGPNAVHHGRMRQQGSEAWPMPPLPDAQATRNHNARCDYFSLPPVRGGF